MKHLMNEEDWESFKQRHWEKNEILIFKFSPICPTSRAAEERFDQWLDEIGAEDLAVAKIDVIGARALSRGLAGELGVRHESPQALWIDAGGKVKWHASHNAITAKALEAQR